MLEGQSHRRFLKTHLPLNALVFAPQVQYLYVGRDGRDTLWSLFNHHASLSDHAYDLINEVPGRNGPPLERPTGDVVQYFREWLDGGGLPLGESFWEHNRGWWEARCLPNVLLVHFNRLKSNMPAEMRRIAGFLRIEIEEELWPTMVEHCTLGYMREAACANATILDRLFQDGVKSFFYKGTNGRWRNILPTAELSRYEAMAGEKLTPACAHWVATGELVL